MPIYSYKNSESGETVEVFQGMNDKHEYFQDGVKWERVWLLPQVGIDTKIDPNSERQFLDKTAKGGTIGDLWDRGRELSEMRKAQNNGVDAIAEKQKAKQEARDRAKVAAVRAERARNNKKK